MLKVISDVAVGNDKPVIVPANRRYTVKSIMAVLLSTATVGNRSLTVDWMDDASNVLMRAITGAVQAASLTNRYNINPSAPRGTAFVANQIDIPIPTIYLQPAWRVRIYDAANIAVLDTLSVFVTVNDRDMKSTDGVADDLG